MLTFTDDTSKVSVSVWHVGEEEGRQLYGWAIGERTAVVCKCDGPGDAVRSGRGDQPALAEGLFALLALFSAYVEAVDPRWQGTTENSDLFPDSCRNLAEALDSGEVLSWAEQVRGWVE